jgi:mono/diheme cytochrome c family protein
MRAAFVGLFVLLVLLSACGLNMSGEPEIVREQEIQAQPTSVPTQAVSSGAASTEQVGGDTVVNAEPDLNLGRELYLANCTACHTAQDGVGPGLATMRDSAAARIEGVSAEDYLRDSIVNPSAFVVEGYEDIMPKTYGDQFTDHDVASLVKFIAEFSPEAMMAQAATATPAGASDATMESISEDALTVNGKLIPGTAGGDPLPPDLPVELHVFSVHGDRLASYNAVAGADGTFTFENVTRAPGDIYFALLKYDGVVQGAQAGRIEGTEETLDLDVTVYETTTDRSSVAITWAQMLINYAPIEEFGVEVRLDVELVNTSDRIVVGEPVEGQEWTSSVSIELPVQAFGIEPMQAAEGTPRYQIEIVNSVPVLYDTWELRPEQVHTITVLYYLPYTNSATFDQAFGYPLMDAVVLLPNDTVKFESDQFADQGEWRYRVAGSGLRVTELDPNEEISPADDFTLIQAFDLSKPLKADERLIFSLDGAPTRTVDVMTPNKAAMTDENTNVLPFVLAGAGIGILLMAGVLWWRQRGAASVAAPVAAWRMPPASAGRDELLQALAELDDAYQAGELDEETYFERREKLKERLIPLIDEDENA